VSAPLANFPPYHLIGGRKQQMLHYLGRGILLVDAAVLKLEARTKTVNRGRLVLVSVRLSL
jgi:hypothetical protein